MEDGSEIGPKDLRAAEHLCVPVPRGEDGLGG